MYFFDARMVGGVERFRYLANSLLDCLGVGAFILLTGSRSLDGVTVRIQIVCEDNLNFLL